MWVVLALALVCAWLQRGVKVQRHAVAALRHAGATVYYSPSRENLWAPGWLVSAVGIDYFAQVRFVSLRGKAKDDDLAEINTLTQLYELDLSKSQITDAGLFHLKGLAHLEILKLHKTQVSDAGMVHLTELPALQILYLVDTNVTQAAVGDLKKLHGILSLRLPVTFSEVGKEELKNALPQALVKSGYPALQHVSLDQQEKFDW